MQRATDVGLCRLLANAVSPMTVDQARRWIVLSSLILTGVFFVFFLIAPVSGYPLTYPQAFRLLQIVTPVFAGYLGAATRFIFGAQSAATNVSSEPLLGIIARGAVIVFGLAIVAALGAFGWTNRTSAPAGIGMSIDTLATAFSLALGLLAVTTGIIVDGIFGRQVASQPAAKTQQGS